MEVYNYRPLKTIIKSESDRLVYGEVAVPYRLDSAGEFMRPEEIRKAAHWFMENSRTDMVDSEHDNVPRNVRIVESYIAKEGDPDGFIPGSWVAGGQVNDDGTWKQVQRGELNGWSLDGMGHKRQVTVKITAVKLLKGETTPSTHPAIESHPHPFMIEFDSKGKVIPTKTKEVNGHWHPIHKTTATEMAFDLQGNPLPDDQNHAHRFDVDWTQKSEGVETEEREQDAVELFDVRPRWISLVEHAAIRRGFKIVKNDEGGDMERVIHAIITDKGTPLEEIAKVPGLEWVVTSKADIKKVYHLSKNDKHVLIPSSEFEIDSIYEQETDKEGVKLLVGILKSDSNAEPVIVGKKKRVFALPPDDDETIQKEDDEMDEKRVQEMIDAAFEAKMVPAIKSELGGLKDEVVEILKSSLEDDTDDDTTTDDTKTQKTEDNPVMALLEKLTDKVGELAAAQTSIVQKTDKLTDDLKSIGNKSASTHDVDDDDDTTTTDDTTRIQKADDKNFDWSGRLINHRREKVMRILEKAKGNK